MASRRLRNGSALIATTVLTTLVMNACATPSQYRSDKPGRASMFVDGSTYLRIEGTDQSIVDSGGFTYRGLGGVLGCVPLSKSYAERAEDNASKASVRVWSGVGIMMAGLAGGIAMIAYGASADRDAVALGGLGVMMGGLIGGFVPIGMSAKYSFRARANSLDAINSYNDLYASTPGCLGNTGAGAPAATLAPGLVVPHPRLVAGVSRVSAPKQGGDRGDQRGDQ